MLNSHHFTCHWDESGADPGTGGRSKSDTPIILVGGYLAHVKNWISFEEKWNPIIKAKGLEFFHMVDFANGNKPYQRWGEDKQKALIEPLLDVISEFPRFRLSCSMEIDDYREVVKANNIGDEDIVRAYHMCARKCIELISDLARVVNHPHKILHIFDRGNPAWPSFEAKFTDSMLESLNILQPITQSKLDILPLQAADILAHQSARSVLIESGRAKKHTKRLYVNSLFLKPGLLIHANRQMVKEWYKEERFIENHRRKGMYPRRITWQNNLPNMSMLVDLFAEPEDHKLTSILREKRLNDKTQSRV